VAGSGSAPCSEEAINVTVWSDNPEERGWKAAVAPLVRRHRKLPWIPTEEQWQALLAVMQGESIRNRLMFALSYDSACVVRNS